MEEDETGIEITISFGSEERFDVPLASIKQDLYTRLGARPDSVVRIRIDQPPIRRVLARVTDVPGFGWTSCTPAALAHPVRVIEGTGVGEGDGVGGARERSGVGGHRPGPTARFAIDGVAGYGRLVDGGDHGDSYNYSPPLGRPAGGHAGDGGGERGRAGTGHGQRRDQGQLHVAGVRRTG